MAAFDALAPAYDREFTHTAIGRYLRGRVHQRLLSHFSAGDHLLELGCGTGEDACILAADYDLQITATDASPAMLHIAREKTRHLPHVTTRLLDLSSLDHALQDADFTEFAGVFSNFGALNCLDDWSPLATWLADHLPSGAVAGFGIMAPYCIWEFAWHALHTDFDVALRRIRGSTFNNLTITYPTIQRITADFAPHFQRTHIMPLGLFLPPSDVFGVIEKRPRLLQFLTSLEEHTGYISQLALFADHYWVEFRRR